MRIKSIILSIYFKLLTPNEVAEKSGVIFGKNCKFGAKNFGSEPYLIKIGDNFYSSVSVQFITHDGAVNVLRNKYEEHKDIDYFAPIIIENNVFIGCGSIILPGTKIEDNVIVGAGSVVKGHMKKNSVYAGIPAKYICSIDDYLEKNKGDFVQTKHLGRADKKKFVLNWVNEKLGDARF